VGVFPSGHKNKKLKQIFNLETWSFVARQLTYNGCAPVLSLIAATENFHKFY
jgi:hypothetical protein